MINFPIFHDLRVSGYGLFPASDSSKPGIDIRFRPGLTLIVGANGLGKTTLITILYRLLTGPFDIPGLDSQTDLGSVRLEIRKLRQKDRSEFAQRVADGGKDATARLSLSIGESKISIERSLA